MLLLIFFIFDLDFKLSEDFDSISQCHGLFQPTYLSGFFLGSSPSILQTLKGCDRQRWARWYRSIPAEEDTGSGDPSSNTEYSERWGCFLSTPALCKMFTQEEDSLTSADCSLPNITALWALPPASAPAQVREPKEHSRVISWALLMSQGLCSQGR